MIATPLLTIEKVTFTYRGGERPALSGADFEVNPGEFVGIVGPTAAGKSTLIRSATGLVPRMLKGQFSGQVSLKGESIADRRVSELAGLAGTVFQDFEGQLFSTSVSRELAFGPENLNLDRKIIRERIERYASLVGIAHLMDREPQSLSGGQKQRLALASVLCLEPDLILGDEPTTDLDPLGKNRILDLLEEIADQGRGVALVERDSQRLLSADRLVVLENGSIVESGPPEQVLADPEFCRRQGILPPQTFELFAALGLPDRPRSPEKARDLLDQAGLKSKPGIKFEDRPEPTGPPLLTADNVSFAYPGGPAVLEGLNLEIKAGEYLALLGSNGSGKSTFIKQLNALLTPTGGRMLFKGESVAEIGPARMGRRIGFVFQNPDEMLFASNVFEEVAFGLRNYGFAQEEIESRVSEVLKTVGLSEAEKIDPFIMTKGDRQKLAVAAVLACEPEILVLDEPTTGLDAQEQDAMTTLLARLNRAGHTVIIVTHSVDLAAAQARRIVLLEKGRILADGPSREVFDQPELLNQAGLTAPTIVQLSRLCGLTALTVSEMIEALKGTAE